jgi:hypothetical protein
MSDTQAPSKESVSQSEPTSYLVEGDTYRKLIAERDAYRSVANDLARQLRQRTPADTNAPPERASHEPSAGAQVLARIVWSEFCQPGSLDDREAAVAKLIQGFIDARAAQPPGVSENPNEGPVVNGLVQIADGVLPAYYNQWKCSQCGRDPRDVQFNGCGYSQSCGRTALTKFASPK